METILNSIKNGDVYVRYVYDAKWQVDQVSKTTMQLRTCVSAAEFSVCVCVYVCVYVCVCVRVYVCVCVCVCIAHLICK